MAKPFVWVRNRLDGFIGKQQNARRILFTSFMLVITVSLLGWLIYRQKEALFSYQWQFRPVPIALSFVFYSLTLFLASQVWYRIITALGNLRPFSKNFCYFCITNLGKRLPGSVWYIPWRARIYHDQGLSLRVVSIASGIELVIMIISGSIVSLIFTMPTIGRLSQEIKFISVVVLFALVALVHPSVIRLISRLFHVSTEEVQYRQIITWVGIYALTWISGGCLLFAVANIITPISIAHLPYLIGVWSLTGVLSMSLLLLPSNLGMTEISLTLFLSVLIPSAVAVILAIGMRILLLFYEIIYAGISMWWLRREARNQLDIQ